MKFNTKHYFHAIIIFMFGLFLIGTNITVAQQPIASGGNGIALPDQPLPQLSEGDLDAMMKMLETMDDETLDALAKIGEDFIKEAEAQGKDPFELLGFPTDPDDDVQPEMPTPEEPIAPEVSEVKEIKVPKVDTHQVREARTMLKNLIDKIAAIRLKAEAERATADKLMPLKYLLDDLVYYLHTLSHDKLLKYLADKEFKKLYKALVQLENDLNYLEPLFVLPEVTLETVSPYTTLGVSRGTSWAEVNEAYQKLTLEKDPRNMKQRLKKEGVTEEQQEETLEKAQTEYEAISEAYNTLLAREQAYQALERIIDSLVRAAYKQNIIEEARKLLKRYEPEAIKIKEEQETLEKKARKEQEDALRRRPPFAPPVFEPLPYFGDAASYEDTYITPTPTDYSYYPTDTSSTSGGGITPTESKVGNGKSGGPSKGKKDSPDKDKAAKKALDTKKPAEPSKDKVSPKVGKKLEAIEKELEALTIYINDGPDVGGKSGKELFKDFAVYMGGAVSKPYDASSVEIAKAKEVNKALPEITKRLNTIKKELRSPILNKEERAQLRIDAKQLWDRYKEAHLKKIGSLFAPGLKTKASPEKDYLHFGGDDLTLDGITGTGKGDEALQDKQARIKFLESVGGTNLLSNFYESYRNLLKELNPTRRN